MRIGFVGVHGVGKSTLAYILSKELDLPFIELECIYEASALPPTQRQLLFLSCFLSDFLKAITKFESVVFSSHPVMVPIYTEFWVGKSEASYMYELVRKLPRLDMLFVLYAPIEVIVKRILMRGRRVTPEEIREEYIKFIQNRTLSLISFFNELAENVEVLDTDKPISELVTQMIAKINVAYINRSV